jgi:5-methylcytosine-specific restriction endonuclease McrA
MIRIDQQQPEAPGLIRTQTYRRLIERLLQERENHDFEERRKYISRLSKKLKGHYRNKCGYCETKVNAAGYLTIDHYRPKKKVIEDTTHPGYYWLGYEWTNFVPACHGCNSAKGYHFPIDSQNGGIRVMGPPMTADQQLDFDACLVDSKIHQEEQPLLLHPIVDIPQQHLIFLPDGTVKGSTRRGNITVQVCGLCRGDLVTDRKDFIDRIFKALALSFRQFIDNEITKDVLYYELDKIFNKIRRAQEPHRPYSQLGWFLFEHFPTFFIQGFGKKTQQQLKKAYGNFREYGTCRKPVDE